MKFYSPCKCGQFEPRVTSVTSRQVRRQGARKYEPVNVTVCRNCGRHETLEFRASRQRLFDLVKSMTGFRSGRQRLFDLIESMTGFTCLQDDLSEIEEVVLSYAGDAPEKREEYSGVVCRGSWALGSACGKCERCEDTRP